MLLIRSVKFTANHNLKAFVLFDIFLSISLMGVKNSDRSNTIVSIFKFQINMHKNKMNKFEGLIDQVISYSRVSFFFNIFIFLYFLDYFPAIW